MKITIETIPHKEQRYETVGDWYYEENGDLRIKVSELSNWRLSALIAVHELVEVLLCQHRGVDQKTVDEFDMAFKGEGEPGDDPGAPYSYEHCFATGIERMLATGLGVQWKLYEDELNAL